MSADTALSRLVASKKVLVCVGSGGVGKTTTAASLGLHAALRGRHVLVLTIDPARRLANALGLKEFGNLAHEVPLPGASGSLAAMMLDMKQTFDDLVYEYSENAEQRRAIRENRFYRSMSQALAGVQEYMAVAKLYDVLQSGEYDLVILDTPPTSHALDFLGAPSRFVEFFDQEVLAWVLKLSSSAGKVGLRLFDLGTSYVLKTLGRFVGLEVLREIGAFIHSFQPLFRGFRERAEKIDELLESPELGFLIVTAPTQQQIDEALFFHLKLEGEGHGLGAIIVNRLHPALPESCVDAAAHRSLRALVGDAADAAIAVGVAHNQTAAAEEREIRRLRTETRGKVPVVTVPELDEDVHDLAGLTELGSLLHR